MILIIFMCIFSKRKYQHFIIIDNSNYHKNNFRKNNNISTMRQHCKIAYSIFSLFVVISVFYCYDSRLTIQIVNFKWKNKPVHEIWVLVATLSLRSWKQDFIFESLLYINNRHNLSNWSGVNLFRSHRDPGAGLGLQ